MKRWILILINGLIFTRISIGEFNIIRGYLGDPGIRPGKGLHCVTDSVDDVLVWNTLDNDFSGFQSGPLINGENRFQPINERECYINKNRGNCLVPFENFEGWQIVSSIKVPMGPVFDGRWEKFEERKRNSWPFKNVVSEGLTNEHLVAMKFRSGDALPVSIRGGTNPTLILCKGADHGSFCHNVPIPKQTLSKMNSNVFEIEEKLRGNSSFSPGVPNQIDDYSLDDLVWDTYLIIWDTDTKRIKFYVPNLEIPSYTDNNSSIGAYEDGQLWFSNLPERNSGVKNPSTFRFHIYNYKLVTTNKFRLTSMSLNIDPYNEICITMTIGLCITCELRASLMYSDGQKIMTKVFSDVRGSQRIDHNLPVWQRVRIAASHLDMSKKSVILELFTQSRDEHGNHWAFDNIEQCLPEGAVKEIFMSFIGSRGIGDSVWPNVTCQKLSYNREHSELISPLTKMTDLPANLTHCPMSRIGPQCAFQCRDTCWNVAICDKNSCYCSPGYQSEQCNELCSEPGAYGYGCAKKCVNCLQDSCDVITGKCEIGCKKAEAKDKYLLPSYCTDAVDIPPVPDVDRTDKTSLRYFFQEKDISTRFKKSYEFEMSLKTPEGSMLTISQFADSETTIVNNRTIQIYFTVFHNLPIGSECRARVVVAVQFEFDDSPIAQEPIFVDGEYSNYTILCKWDQKFMFGWEARTLIISRNIQNKTMHSCPDDWYTVTVRPESHNVNESGMNHTISVVGKFPMVIRNLTSDINYVVSIRGMSSKSQYNRVVQTSVIAALPKVKDLTIVEVDWKRSFTIVRWQKLLPSTNPQIIQYAITTLGNRGKAHEYYYSANKTCPEWNDSYCVLVPNPARIERIIKVRAVYEGGDVGEFSQITDHFQETAPDPPGIPNISKTEEGFELEWEHPLKSGGPISKFIIHLEVISTRLMDDLQEGERNRTIHFPVTIYYKRYGTQLKLLPSTQYNISVRGVVESQVSRLTGEASSAVIETPSSCAFEYEPSCTVNNNDRAIILSLPPIHFMTQNTQVHVIAIGPKTCPESFVVKGDLANAIELKNDEVAWIVGSFSQPPPFLLIGNHESNNGITSCPLQNDVPYAICIVVQDQDIGGTRYDQPIVWRSKLVTIIQTARYPHAVWVAPVLVFLIVIIGIIVYSVKKKRLAARMAKNLVYDVPDNVSQHPITIECRASFLLRLSHDDVNRMPANGEEYEEINYTSMVELNKFQDYVKTALTSGELNEQYSWLSSRKEGSWRCSAIRKHGDKMAMVLTKHLDRPDFARLNAHYIHGYKRNKAYIVLKGPEPAAVINFWRMIWQERVQVICMLSDDMSDEQVDYTEYWPKIGNCMDFGNISVFNVNYATFADYTFRTFHVKCDQQTRKIEHLHYTAWPDKGTPLYTQSIVTYLQKLLAIASGIGPVLVHCHVDLGRTGTIILCDISLRRAAAEGVIDVFNDTADLKEQKNDMVGNKQQYILAHVALVECLLSLPTAIPCDSSLPTRILTFKNQLQLQQQRLEQSEWQDEALQACLRLQYKLSEKNLAKNRYPELLPMSRLYIPRYPTSDDDSSYISGVYVDSARRRNSYIASQLPMLTTMNDFWRMIAAFNIELIIILQGPDIQDPTCCNFLPQPDQELETVSFLSIRGKSVTDEEHFQQQKVVVIDKSTEPSRELSITILTSKNWTPGRHKSPPMPESLINLWQMSERISRNDEPTVVLCHDGVTGCGLYLALSFLLERMGLERECDVCFAIRAIRRSRSNFCRATSQFEYLYNAAMLYAEHFDAYANFK